MCHVESKEIEAVCIAGGSQYSRVMLVSTVVRIEGMFNMFNLYSWYNSIFRGCFYWDI